MKPLQITYQTTGGGSRCVPGSGYEWSYDQASNRFKENYQTCTCSVEVQGMLMLESLSDQLGVIH